MPERIYSRPRDYDLEHEGDDEDIAFFVQLAARLKPRRVLELASGTGRVTLPLAEEGARSGFQVVGLELEREMLDETRRRLSESKPDIRANLRLVEGDMRTWEADQPFDLILVPCSSMCHLLTLEDQLQTWRRAFDNIAPGGRFVVDAPMPNLAAYADSFTTPPRSFLEVDRDTRDEGTGERLIRYRTTRYIPHEQRARILYLYDKFSGDSACERFASDYESHVYFPRELRLLFISTGFCIEDVYGDYRGRPLDARSRRQIVVGEKQ